MFCHYGLDQVPLLELGRLANVVRQCQLSLRSKGRLRVKGVRGASGIFEMTWAPNGRATFHYGEPIKEGEPHLVWRRVGTHDTLSEP